MGLAWRSASHSLSLGRLISMPFTKLTLIPSILYVVGGLWLLGYLFQRQEDMKEFGAVATTRIIVS